jgi:hypothetical protein
MKHHFGDYPERSLGHWQMLPNRDRYRHGMPEDVTGLDAAVALSLTRHHANWREALTLPRLAEVTLHEPSTEQIAALPGFAHVKRLRITHARVEDLEVLAGLAVEELVLEYVSGFADLSPIARMPALRSLHLENLRGVTDFAPLAQAKGLRYLGIRGTDDWRQPVQPVAFLQGLARLEALVLGQVRVQGEELVDALLTLPALRLIHVPRGAFAVQTYARIEALLPHVAGTVFAPVWADVVVVKPLPPHDFRARLPPEELKANHPEVMIFEGGHRVYHEPEDLTYFFLDKGVRSIKCNAKGAHDKADAARVAYAALKDQARKGVL